MTNRIDRVNRAVFLLLGIIALAVGVGGILLATAVFGHRRQHEYLLTQPETRFADRNAGWFWLCVAAAAFVIFLLALRWLFGQSGTSRMSTLNLERDRSAGETKLHGGALTDALCEDVEGYRGVSGAKAALLGRADKPRLRLDVGLTEDADLGAVRQRIEQQALPRARQASSLDQLPVRLRLSVAATDRRRID